MQHSGYRELMLLRSEKEIHLAIKYVCEENVFDSSTEITWQYRAETLFLGFKKQISSIQMVRQRLTTDPQVNKIHLYTFYL